MSRCAMQHVLEIAVISARGGQCSNAMSGITLLWEIFFRGDH